MDFREIVSLNPRRYATEEDVDNCRIIGRRLVKLLGSTYKLSGSRLISIAEEHLTRKEANLLNTLPPYGSVDLTTKAAAKLKIAMNIHSLAVCSCCGKPIWNRKPLDKDRLYNCSIECKVNSPSVRAKTEATNIARYGTKNVRSSSEIKERIRETMLERYGVSSWAKLPEARKLLSEKAKAEQVNADYTSRREATNIERYGSKNPSSSPIVKAKVWGTQSRNHGGYFVETKEFREKAKATFFKKSGGKGYGPLSKPESADKRIRTNLQRFGVEHPMQAKEVKEMSKATQSRKYGGPAAAHPEVQAKMRATSMKHWGVEHAIQNPEVAERILKSRFEYSTVRLNGCKLQLQGRAEPRVANDLARRFPNSRFKRANNLAIWWEDVEGKRHRYLPDFLMHNEGSNFVVEVKSLWTLGLAWDKQERVLYKTEGDNRWKTNLLKLKAAAKSYPNSHVLLAVVYTDIVYVIVKSTDGGRGVYEKLNLAFQRSLEK